MAPNIADKQIDFPNLTEYSVENSSSLVPKARKAISFPTSSKLERNEKQKRFLSFEDDIKWMNSIMIVIFHGIAAYGLITLPYIERWKTFIWMFVIFGSFNAFGITGGAHRFWSHKAYKANFPLRVILMFCYLSAGQNSMYNWVRDHRVHHKYTETDADPHNTNRGFFFSHVGWLMLKKHPDVIKRGKEIDMSDIEADPIVMFCEKYFIPLKIIIAFVLPITVPVYFWNEEWYYAALFSITRHVVALNSTWSVNSFAHFFGNKPYDKNIAPAENKFVSIMSFGEGWHNYHHTFPSDYRAAELGGIRFSPTTQIIDFFAKIGWAYDLKVPSDSLKDMIISKRGDGTHGSQMDHST